MLYNLGKPTLLVKLGRLVCVCMRRSRLGSDMVERLRALHIAGLACWCDRSDSG